MQKVNWKVPEGTVNFYAWLQDRVNTAREHVTTYDDEDLESLVTLYEAVPGHLNRTFTSLICVLMAMLRSPTPGYGIVLEMIKSFWDYGVWQEIADDEVLDLTLGSITGRLSPFCGELEPESTGPRKYSNAVDQGLTLESCLTACLQSLHPRTRGEFINMLHPRVVSLLAIPIHTSWRIFVDLKHEDGSLEPFPRYEEALSINTLKGRHEVLKGKTGVRPIETDLHVRSEASGSCTVMQLYDKLEREAPTAHVRVRMCAWRAGQPELVACGPFEPWGHLANHCRDLFLDESAVDEIIWKVRNIMQREREAPLHLIPGQGIAVLVRPTITVYSAGQWDMTTITG